MPNRQTEKSTQPLQIDYRTAQVVSVLDQYLADLKAGKPISREEVLAAHPLIADQLDACLGGMEFIHQVESSAGAGQVLGDFRILRELGRGGMGAVYEAEQRSLGRRVALKVLRFGSVSDPDALERFQREATTVATLHHTNIVPIFAVGSDHGVNYYAMQLVEGQSLDRLLKQSDQPLPPETVAEWGLQAAEALAHAHRRDVIHRDVKPSNLILDDEGRLWLTDFGLAKRMDDVTLSMTGALLGTPRYMSPEQAAASTRKVDHRTDIYSLGATLYELVTGQPVFASDTPHGVISQILSDDPQPLRRHRPDLPRDLETIVLKCLSKEPHERYESASDLSDDLRAFLDGRPIRARQPGPIEFAARWVKRHRRSVAMTSGAVAATVAVAVALVLGWQRYASWILAFVSFFSEQGPFVAEMVNDEGLPLTGAVTVPTQQPLSVPHGDYEVHVAAAGKLSQTYDIALPRGVRSEFEITPGDDVLTELEIERTVALIRFAERTQPLLMDDDGLQLHGLDGAEWRLNLAEPTEQLLTETAGFVWPWDAVLRYLERGGYDKLDLRPFLARWSAAAQRNTDSWTAIPRGDAVDLDGDGTEDIVLAARHQAWMLAVSGTTGKPLWFIHRGDEFQAEVGDEFRRKRKNYGVRSAALYPPRWVNDTDGDNRPDLLAVFANVGIDEDQSKPQRWVEAFSGTTGLALWRYDLPNHLFATDDEAATPYALRWFAGGVQGYGTDGGYGMSNWRGRIRRWSGRVVERTGRFATMPTDLHFSVNDQQGSQSVLLLAGSHLVELDLHDGRPVTAPRELGFVSGLPAVWGDLDGDGGDDLVLVQKLPDIPNTITRALNHSVPRARITGWSVPQARTLWTRDVTARWPKRPLWNVGHPEWPLVVDLDNDGACEAIVPNGSSLERQQWRFRSTPWGAIEVLDGKTGREVWNRQLVTMDEFLERFTVGPDIDGDGFRELYVAALWRDEFVLFVDCLSGADGRSLWCSHRTLTAQGSLDHQLGNLDWWNHGIDGWPQLMATVCDPRSSNGVHRVIFSAGTGKNVRFGSQLPHAAAADFDGDRIDDLGVYRVKPGQTSESLDRGGTLQLVRGSQESWRKLTSRLQPAGDLDRDGVCDLLQSHNLNLVAVAGATGRTLWRADISRSHGSRRAVASQPGWDLNANAADDLLIYVDDQYLRQSATSPIQARDGSTGNILWKADLEAKIIVGTPMLDCRDLDGDGRPEVLFVSALNLDYRHTNYSPQATQLWLVVLSGTDGTVRWRAPLTLDYGNVGRPSSPYQPRQMKLAVSYADVNGDGCDDVLIPAETNANPAGVELRTYSSVDGMQLWRYELPGTTHREQDLLDNVPPAAVGDLDGDGQLEVVVLAFEDGANGRTAHIRALDAVDGTQQWSWQAVVAGDCGNVYYGDARQVRPLPMLLKAGKTQYVCLNLYHESARLVVLDHAGAVVSDLMLSEDESPRQFRVWAGDSASDGHDEIAMVLDKKLALLSPDDLGRPLWTNSAENNWQQILEIKPAAEDEAPTIVAQTADLDNHVVGVNARTGEVEWVCAGPTPHGPGWAGSTQATLLNSSEVAASRQPVVHFAYKNASLVRQVAEASRHQRVPPRTKPIAHDPRLYRPLPWSPDQRGNHWSEFVRNAMWATFFAVTMVVLPLGLVWRPVTHRRWSLRNLLLLPVVAGVFLLAALIPNPGEPIWPVVDRLVMALAALPGLVFVTLIIRCAVTRYWSRVALWLTVLVIVTLLLVAFGLLVIHPREIGPLLPGERYATDGWYLVWLMGAYLTGCLAIVIFPIASVWERWKRSRV